MKAQDISPYTCSWCMHSSPIWYGKHVIVISFNWPAAVVVFSTKLLTIVPLFRPCATHELKNCWKSVKFRLTCWILVAVEAIILVKISASQYFSEFFFFPIQLSFYFYFYSKYNVIFTINCQPPAIIHAPAGYFKINGEEIGVWTLASQVLMMACCHQVNLAFNNIRYA